MLDGKMVMRTRRAVSVAGDGGRLSLVGGDQVADEGSIAFRSCG